MSDQTTPTQEEQPLEAVNPAPPADDADAVNAADAPPAAEPGPDWEGEARQWKDRYLRAAAEVENTRKRLMRERESAVERERQRVLGAFLEVIDNFERAIALAKGTENEWVHGMEAIHRQMIDVLLQHHVTAFDAKAEDFDSMRHEVVGTLEVDHLAEGTIVDVVRTGYQTTDGKVVRTARVLVARPKSQA